MTNIASFTPTVKESLQFFNKETALSVAKKMAQNEQERIEIIKPIVSPVFDFIGQEWTLPEVISAIAWSLGFNYVAKFYEEYIQALRDIKTSLEQVLKYDSDYCVEIISKNRRKEFKKLDPSVRAEVCLEVLNKHINFAKDCKAAPQSPSCKKLKEKEDVLEKAEDYKTSLEETLEKVDSLAKSISQLENTPPLFEAFTFPINVNKQGLSLACKRMNLKPSATKRGLVWGLGGYICSSYISTPVAVATKGVTGIYAGGKAVWNRFVRSGGA